VIPCFQMMRTRAVLCNRKRLALATDDIAERRPQDRVVVNNDTDYVEPLDMIAKLRDDKKESTTSIAISLAGLSLAIQPQLRKRFKERLEMKWLYCSVVVGAVFFGCGMPLNEVAEAKADAADTEWLGYNGGYDATRFSPLNQINTKNVAQLKEVARFKIPETLSFQCGPVVVGDTMFITTVTSTYAIDARTGKQRWVRTIKPTTHMIGTPVRGVAYADERLFRGTMDGHVLALDAKTGDVLWDVPSVDPAAGEYYTAVPVAWNGLVLIGNSGSDMGGIGHIRAFEASTGKQVWNFDTVPSTGEGADTWPNDPDKHRAGGGVYSSFALDPEAGIVYVPVGNPGPDFVKEYRPGDNLFSCGVVALDAKTGELKGYHQFVKNDFHDWDVAASPILLNSKAGRRIVAAACKNGYLYGLSRDLKDELFKTAVTRIENTAAPLTKEGTRFLPGTQGGTNWYGPSYSPPLNALFVPAIDWATTVKLGGPEDLKRVPGKPFIGSANAFGDQDSKSQRFGHITAVDADSGKVLWKYDANTALVASVTPTAGGVLFSGDTTGNFLAFDGANGHVLLKKDMHDAIGGGTITYLLEANSMLLSQEA